MAQITVSISDELERDLRDFANKNGYATLSALVSDAIRDKLKGDGPDYWQRVSMVLQLKNNQLLETLVGEKELVEGKDWQMSQTYDVLRSGYAGDYRNEFEYVSRDEFSKARATFVYDILDAYRDLQWSAKELGDDNLVTETRFPGFDGNRDYEELGYVRHLVGNGRWEMVEPVDKSYNSHGAEPNYRAMIERHKEVRSREREEDRLDYKPLSRADIDYILKGDRAN